MTKLKQEQGTRHKHNTLGAAATDLLQYLQYIFSIYHTAIKQSHITQQKPITMASSTQAASTAYLPSQNPQRIQSLKAFLASDQIVTIIPSFPFEDPLDFLITQESIGPFQAGIETPAPLWLALYLRKRNLCRLKCPSWMEVDNLKNVLKHERDPKINSFSTDLPFRYAEVSRAVLQACGAGRSAAHASGGMGGNEEVPQAEVVRVLLEDISMVRMDKIRRNVHTLSAQTMAVSLEKPMPVLDVTGIGAVEMAAIKPFLEGAFEDHLKLVRTGTGNKVEKPGRRVLTSVRARRRRNKNIGSNEEDESGTGNDVMQGVGEEENDGDMHSENTNGDGMADGENDDEDEEPSVSKSNLRRYRS